MRTSEQYRAVRRLIGSSTKENPSTLKELINIYAVAIGWKTDIENKYLGIGKYAYNMCKNSVNAMLFNIYDSYPNTFKREKINKSWVFYYERNQNEKGN